MSDEVAEARVPQSEIPGLYDSIAPAYDGWARLFEAGPRERALRLAEVRDGEDVLEVAVGTGLGFLEIVRRNPCGTNIGIDISAGMLERARRRLADLGPASYDLRLGDALTLDLPDESVDLLVNAYMFDLLPLEAMDRALREFRRVLRPRGRLILVNMAHGEVGSAVYGWIYRIAPRLIGGCRGVRLAGRLERLGFRLDLREVHQRFLFPSEVIRAFKEGSDPARVAAG